MSPQPAFGALATSERNRLEALLMEFEEAWQPSTLGGFVSRLETQPGERFRQLALTEMVKIDLQRSWASGEGRMLDEYLSRFPSLGKADSVGPDLVAAEFEAIKLVSSDVTLSSYQTRFPRQFTQVEEIVRLNTASSQTSSSDLDRHPNQASIDTSRIGDALDTKGESANGESPDAPTVHLPTQFGRYQILKELGAGAMGKVYLAHDTQLDRKVALKTPSFAGHDKSDLVARFYREARAVAKLHHRNICPIFDVGEIDDRHFISMAFVKGRCLSEFIQPGKLPPTKTSAILVQRLAGAMAEAHHHHVIHRDLKPANIMIDHKKQPIVMDFGLARELDSESQFTRAGTAVGTPAYMSPEQIRGDLDEVGVTADIYALGVILYELLCGQLPFRGPIAKVVYAIVHQDAEPLSKLRKDLDPDLEAICAKMMAKDQTERYQSMDEVADVLARYLKGSRDQQKTRSSQASPNTNDSAIVSAKVSETGALNAFFATQIDSGQQKTIGTDDPSSAPIIVESQPKSIPQKSTLHRARHSGRKRNRPVLIALAASVAGLLILGMTMWLKVGDAVLQVEINDPSIGVTVQNRTLTIDDNGREIKLRPNDNNRLSIAVGETSFQTEKTYELVKGENPAVQVTLLSDEVVAKLGRRELGRWPLKQAETSDRSNGSSKPRSPYEFLTSPDYEWTEPVFIGHFDMADNLDVALTDDITEWYTTTSRLPSLIPNRNLRNLKNDIWLLTREPGAPRWNTPVHQGGSVNRPNWKDQDPTISPDGLELIFSSDRPGGQGGGDLWICRRETREAPWSEAVNMGRGINSSGWEWSCHISPDGLELYFASGRRGKGDLFKSERERLGDPWEPPIFCGWLNGPDEEYAPVVSSDGRVICFLSGDRPGGKGSRDIWMSARPNRGSPWSQAVNLPETINTSKQETPFALSADGSLLLFGRYGEGLMSSRRVPKVTRSDGE
ncbi:MAG: protein kinase [Planctomycetota bacterium]